MEGRSVRLTSQKGVRHSAGRVNSIPRLVEWSYHLFVFTIPFEHADLPFTSSSFSLTKAAALIFFGFYFYYLLQRRFIPLDQGDNRAATEQLGKAICANPFVVTPPAALLFACCRPLGRLGLRMHLQTRGAREAT